MDENVERLAKETGKDPILISMILKFTNNDYNGALEIINSIEKNVRVIEVKFIAQSFGIFGTFILIYNVKTKVIHLFDMVCLKGDKSAIEFDFSKNWKEFHREIEEFKSKVIIDNNIFEKIKVSFTSEKMVSQLDVAFNKKEDVDDVLKKIIQDNLINVLGDINIALKMNIIKIDIFELNKKLDIDIFNKDDDKIKKENQIVKNVDIIRLKIEPDILPVNGTKLSDLKIGDLIGVKIVDERPIANYILNLLTGNSQDSNKDTVVFAKLQDIEYKDESFFVTVEFGPGIIGQAYFPEDINLNVKRSSDDSVESDNNRERESVGDLFFTKYFWVMAAALITVLVALIIFVLYNS